MSDAARAASRAVRIDESSITSSEIPSKLMVKGMSRCPDVERRLIKAAAHARDRFGRSINTGLVTGGLLKVSVLGKPGVLIARHSDHNSPVSADGGTSQSWPKGVVEIAVLHLLNQLDLI